MKSIKTLGLLAISALALVAFVGTASASASVFKAGAVGKKLTTVTLSQHIFKITGAEVKCSLSDFEGETEALESESQTVHPVYKECEAFGFKEGVSVTTTGCEYTFNANTTPEMGAVTVKNCGTEAGGEKGVLIKVNIPLLATCEVLVPDQEIPNAVSYANNAGEIKVKATAIGIKSNVVKSTGLCPLTTGLHEGAEKGGTYTGESEVSAEGTTIEYVK